MTKWFAWFQFKDLEPICRVLAAKDLKVATMMAQDLADRDKVELLGVIVASEQFNPPETMK